MTMHPPWRQFGLLVALSASISLLACVSSGEHEALQKDLDGVRQQLGQTQLDLDAERDEAKKLRAEQQSLQGAIEALEAEKQSLAGQQLRLQEELAQVVKDKSKLAGSVEEMKQALAELAARKAEAEKRVAEYKKLLERFKALIDAGKLKVKIVDGRMVVALATDVLFASGSASLAKDGKTAIEEVTAILAEIPGRSFQVEGHTDDVPIKTAQYPSNWELAAARALTVVKTMVDAGMPAERISAASFGQNKPAGPNDSPEGRAANRRIDIVVVPDLSSLPGFEELQKASGS
ncbi:MAG: OmpA family protein [Pseudomonadota bacterium]